jgi:predicted amidohydrolase YtcJ
LRKLKHFEQQSYGHVPVIVAARTIHTLAAGEQGPEAMLVLGGDIVATGSLEHCRAMAANVSTVEPQLQDFGDAAVVPGFIDPHAHPLMLGQMMSWVDCGPAKAASIPEIVALLQAAVRNTPAGQPVRGYGYEHRNLAEGRHPTRHELDQVATDREVYLMNASGHGGVVNSYTFELHGVSRETPDPKGGVFFRDNDGELTGELSDAQHPDRPRGCEGGAPRPELPPCR